MSAEAEARGIDRATITWQGFEFSVPASVEDWDPDVLEAFEKNQAITAVKALLGDSTYAKLRKHAQKNGLAFNVRTIGEVMGLVAEAMGFGDAGN